MTLRITVFMTLLAISAYMVLTALSAAGISAGGLFADPADGIRAEAELKRVDVELLERTQAHAEMMFLIEKATRPRTPWQTHILLLLLAGISICLILKSMRDRERRRWAEIRFETITAPEPKSVLPDNKMSPEDCISADHYLDSTAAERGAFY